MPCITDGIVPVCGFHASCEAFENVSSFCECEPGWSQTLELNYYVDRQPLNSTYCGKSEITLDTLYGLTVVLSVIGALLELSSVSNIRGMKKRLPYFAFCTLLFSNSLYRMLNPDALFGSDIAFTFIFSQIYLVIVFQVRIFVTKYLKYIYKKLERGISDIDKRNKLKRRNRLYDNASKVVSTLWVINVQLFWVSAIIDDMEISLIIMRFALSFVVFRCLVAILFYIFAINEIQHDMKLVLVNTIELGINQGSSSRERSNTDVNPGKAMEDFLKNRIPQLKKLKTRLIIGEAFIGIAHLLPIISDWWLMTMHQYTLPLVTIACILMSMVIFFDRKKHKQPLQRSCFGLSMSSSAKSEKSTHKSLKQNDAPKSRTTYLGASAVVVSKEIQSKEIHSVGDGDDTSNSMSV